LLSVRRALKAIDSVWMRLYAITDRKSLGEGQEERLRRLLVLADGWARGGVDFLQIREKDLPPADLLDLSRQIVAVVRSTGAATRVLVNGDAGLAGESGADGVHLPGGVPSGRIDEARKRWLEFGGAAAPVVSVACHSTAEVERARDEGATMAVFAPVFGKRLDSGEVVPGAGLDELAEACRVAGGMPVFALGGITSANARQCMEAGAAGIAAIRLFAADDWLALRASHK
jgi:thiamine-phosphate pyrophosphorylase